MRELDGVAAEDRDKWLGAVIERYLDQAEGGDSDELQAERAEALAYYNGDRRGDEIEGRSQQISMDVADCVNATLAMMGDMLVRDAKVSIDPDSDQDEISARAESDILNDVLMKDNPGERVLLASIKDALLLKNGCLKVRVEDRDTGDGKLRLFRVESVPIENVSYLAAYEGPLQDIGFFAEKVRYTRSDLVEMGVDRATVDELEPLEKWWGEVAAERDQSWRPGPSAETSDQDVIECHEAYIRVDLDDDGISERWQVLVANKNKVLGKEKVDLLPYALGVPFLNPHRLTGESLFDRLKQIQDGKTALLRQLQDNVTVQNNYRVAFNPDLVRQEDVLNALPGGGIRVQDINAIMQLPVLDVTGGILQALDSYDRRRSQAAGAALDMGSAEAQVAFKSATAASIERGNQELVTNMIARNLAVTMMRDLYLLLHEFLRRYAQRPYVARVAGQSVPVDPRQWPQRTRLTVQCGLSPTERASRQATLGQLLQLQSAAMQAGLDGIVADVTTLYRTATRWLELGGIEEPQRYVIDPQSPSAQQAQAGKQQQAQAMQQAQETIQRLMFQLEQAKLAEDARQHDADVRFKYYDADQKAEIEEAKLTGQGVIELEKQRMVNDGQRAAAAIRGPAGDRQGSGRVGA